MKIHNKKAKKQVILQVQAQPKKKKSKSLKKPSSRRDQKVSFAYALKNPFDPMCLGIQVPDPFNFPTSAYHSHTTSVIGSNAVGQTTGCVAFMPNPLLSMIDLFHWKNVGTAAKCVQTTPLITYSTAVNYIGNGTYGVSTVTDMSSKLASFRVASWGIKISNLQPELTATGRIFVAEVPLMDTIPNINSFTQGSTLGWARQVFGIDINGLASSTVLNLPSAVEYSVGDLLRGDIQIAGMYTNPVFWSFKSCQPNQSGQSGFVLADSLEVDTTGANPYPRDMGMKDPLRCVGGCAIIVYYEGFPENVTNQLQIELIYHLEGTPQLETIATSTIVPSARPQSLVGSNRQVEEAMQEVGTIDKAISYLQKGTMFITEHSDTLKSVYKGVRAMATALGG